MARLHQVKSSFTGEKFRNTDYYCGKKELTPVSEIGKPDPRADCDHCKRCLRALQLKKGEAYLRERGLPVQEIKKY